MSGSCVSRLNEVKYALLYISMGRRGQGGRRCLARHQGLSDVLIPEKGCGSDQAGKFMAPSGGSAAQGTSSRFPLDLPGGSQ